MTSTAFVNTTFGLLSGLTQRCSLTLTGYITIPPGCILLNVKSACLVKGACDIYDEDGKFLYSSLTTDKRFGVSHETARALYCVAHSPCLFWSPENVSGGASVVPGTILIPYQFATRSGNVPVINGWFNMVDSVWKISGADFGLFPVPAFTQAAPMFTGDVTANASCAPASVTLASGASQVFTFTGAVQSGGLEIMLTMNNAAPSTFNLRLWDSSAPTDRFLEFIVLSAAVTANGGHIKLPTLPGMDRITITNKSLGNLVITNIATAHLGGQMTIQLLEDLVAGVP